MKIIIHHTADHIDIESPERVEKHQVIAQLKQAIEYLENCPPEQFVSRSFVRSLFFSMRPPLSQSELAKCQEELKKWLNEGEPNASP